MARPGRDARARGASEIRRKLNGHLMSSSSSPFAYESHRPCEEITIEDLDSQNGTLVNSQPIDQHVLAGWKKTALLTLIMSAVLLPSQWIDVPALNTWGTLAMLGGMLAVGVGVVFAGAKWLRMDELHWLLKRKAA